MFNSREIAFPGREMHMTHDFARVGYVIGVRPAAGAWQGEGDRRLAPDGDIVIVVENRLACIVVCLQPYSISSRTVMDARWEISLDSDEGLRW